MLGFDQSENLTQLSDANQHPHVGVEFHCQLDLVEPTPMFIHHHRAVGFRPTKRQQRLDRNASVWRRFCQIRRRFEPGETHYR